MFHALLVFVGSGLGGLLRYGVGILSVRWMGVQFPWGTFAINIAGSFVMGGVAAVLLPRMGQPEADAWRLFLAIGVLGGFTTFSSFSLDTLLLFERGELAGAAAYVGGSVALSLAAVAAGHWLVRSLGG